MPSTSRIAAASHAAPFEALARLGSGELLTSLDDGVTRPEHHPENAAQRTVTNRLLKQTRMVYLRERRAGRDPFESAELREAFECTIGMKLMRRPVLDQYGHHYDARHLDRWAREGGRDGRAPVAGRGYAADRPRSVEDPLAGALAAALRARPPACKAPGIKQMRRAPTPEAEASAPPQGHAVPCSVSGAGCAAVTFGILTGFVGTQIAAAVVGAGSAAHLLLDADTRAWGAEQLRSLAEALEGRGPPVGL